MSGIAGDQQAALFGQACVEPGMTKNTYGTGSFVLTNIGAHAPDPVEGLLTTVAWSLNGAVSYAMEGAIFVTGAAIQWLRDGLQIITDAAEAGPLAASVPDNGGVALVPAFTGLGLAVVGSVRARHDRRHHARHDPRPLRPRRDRSDGAPNRRCRPRDHGRGRHRAARDCASTAARR